MNREKQLIILLLKEKLERLTNKKVILKEYSNALVYPKDILNLIAANSEGIQLSNFDMEQIRTLILNAMTDGKIVERKDVKLFIDAYVSQISNKN